MPQRELPQSENEEGDGVARRGTAGVVTRLLASLRALKMLTAGQGSRARVETELAHVLGECDLVIVEGGRLSICTTSSITLGSCRLRRLLLLSKILIRLREERAQRQRLSSSGVLEECPSAPVTEGLEHYGSASVDALSCDLKSSSVVLAFLDPSPSFIDKHERRLPRDSERRDLRGFHLLHISSIHQDNLYIRKSTVEFQPRTHLLEHFGLIKCHLAL